MKIFCYFSPLLLSEPVFLYTLHVVDDDGDLKARMLEGWKFPHRMRRRKARRQKCTVQTTHQGPKARLGLVMMMMMIMMTMNNNDNDDEDKDDEDEKSD